ncbi:potassium-transporting ATPase subunit KdpC [uncultured Friedmanniella sp.]|uniref:potassium-transporting ATPase subunit KdpC n=1 Tax=uncultured Friedmanniella sp. TaxID=335381 RepID=UPI0035CB2B9D
MFFRQVLTGLRLLLVLTVLLGVGYPLVVTGVGQLAFPHQANGSQLATGHGSSLIGQEFKGDEWFASRPSANDYDAEASGGSNAGPSDPDLVATIAERRAAVAQRDGVDPAAVPPDAMTASASGLDPFISPAYAALQEARVARVRGLDPTKVAALVAESTSGRALGFLGEPRVNVVLLNAALAAQA